MPCNSASASMSTTSKLSLIPPMERIRLSTSSQRWQPCLLKITTWIVLPFVGNWSRVNYSLISKDAEETRKGAHSSIDGLIHDKPNSSRWRLPESFSFFWLVLGSNFNKLELPLVPLTVNLDLLRSPVADRTCLELLFRESDVRYLLRPFIELYSRHGGVGPQDVVKVSDAKGGTLSA